jgi:hypothetical protein
MVSQHHISDMSEQSRILPTVAVLEATKIETGEEGRLTLVGRRLVFITERGIRFGVDLNNIVNLEIAGDTVELETRLSGVTIRAVRFKALKNDMLKWFRRIFFAWVLSNGISEQLVLGRDPILSGE